MPGRRPCWVAGPTNNQRRRRLLTTIGENSSKSGVADTSSATQANIWSVCLHRAVLCVLIVVCRDCVKAAGSEFRRIKKEHPGGVAAWLQEQNKQPTPGAKPKLRLGSLTRATEMTKASRVPPSALCCNLSQGIKELSLTLT